MASASSTRAATRRRVVHLGVAGVLLLISPELSCFLGSRDYWEAFMERNEELVSFDGLGGQRLLVPCDGGGISIDFTCGAEEVTLSVELADGRGRCCIAEDNDSHPIPHVLRLSELSTISQYASAVDPSLRHPGTLLLLLQRFCPICTEDDYASICATLRQAWASLDIFSDAEVESFLDHFDCREAGFRWVQDGEHWIIEQVPTSERRWLHSTRKRGSTEFPFAEWEAMMRSMSSRAGSK
jgi:hypothetical protein